MVKETGIRFRQGEVESRSRQILSQVDEGWYTKKRQEFNTVQGMMYVSALKQGEILAEMRHRAPSFLVRLSHETGDTEERLNWLADFWEYFRTKLPREDINLAYYLQICRSVRLICAVWKDREEISPELVIDEAVSKLASLNPASGESPRLLADEIEELFGITQKGARPFSGIKIILSENEDELVEMSERFHEAVRPLFLQFAHETKAKKQEEKNHGKATAGKAALPKGHRYQSVFSLTLEGSVKLPEEQIQNVTKALEKTVTGLDIEGQIVKTNCFQVTR